MAGVAAAILPAHIGDGRVWALGLHLERRDQRVSASRAKALTDTSGASLFSPQHLRHPGESRGPVFLFARSRELDTGLRRYDAER